MPIYEYRCEDCGYQFETLVKNNEEVTCPKCKGKNLTRLLSACSFTGSSKSNVSVSSGGNCSTCSSFS